MGSRKNSRRRRPNRRTATAEVADRTAIQPMANVERATDEGSPAVRPALLEKQSATWTRNDKIQFAIGILAALAFGVNGVLWYSQQWNFQAQQRAWLGATAGEIADVEAGKKAVISVRVTNSGLTPAVNSEALLMVRLLAPDRACAPNWSDPLVATTSRSSSVVFPNDGVTLVAEHKEMLTPERLQELDAGRTHLCVNILVRYEDSFGNAHETEVCGFAYRSPRTGKHSVAPLSKQCNRAD